MSTPLPARGRRHFDGQTYDPDLLDDMLRFQRLRHQWIHKYGTDKHFERYYTLLQMAEAMAISKSLRRDHVHSHRHFQA